MNKKLLKKFSVKCPRCDAMNDVAPDGAELLSLQCSGCQHAFKARLPGLNNRQASEPVLDSTSQKLPLSEVELTGLPAAETSFSGNPWAVRKRNPLFNPRALGVACAVVAGLSLIFGVGYAISRFDYSQVDLSSLGAEADTHLRLYEDWSKSVAKQSQMLATVDHITDCSKLTAPYELLLTRHGEYLRRAVRLGGITAAETVTEASFELPVFPVARSGRRRVETLLTPEFRRLENEVNAASDAVLHYLTFSTRPSKPKFSDLPADIESQAEVRLRVLSALAKVDRVSDLDPVGLEIYAIATELKSAAAPTTAVVSQSTADSRDLLGLLDEMRTAMARPYLQDSNSGLAKALVALEDALPR